MATTIRRLRYRAGNVPFTAAWPMTVDSVVAPSAPLPSCRGRMPRCRDRGVGFF
jgi:hypothetical protein